MIDSWPVPHNNFQFRKETFFPYFSKIGQNIESSPKLTSSLSSWKFKLISWIDPLEKILTSFYSRNIYPVIVKGASLSFDVYPEIFSRPFSDIDMFVPSNSIGESMNILFSLGYQKSPVHVKSTIHHTFIKEGWPPVELHFALSRDFKTKFTIEEYILSEKREIGFGKTVIYTPNPLFHSAYIMLHALNHAFLHSPLWSLDLLLLSRKYPEINKNISNFMKKTGLDPIYNLSVLLLNEIYGSSHHPFKSKPGFIDKTRSQFIKSIWKKEEIKTLDSVMIRLSMQNDLFHSIEWICDRF